MTVTRRKFLGTTASVAALATTSLAAPAIATASRTKKEIILGEGDYKYRVHHYWPQLPDKYSWQTTHNVAVDKAGNVYVIHEGHRQLKDHPSIFVFDSTGKFIRAFGCQFQGGGHGIEVREEDGTEFLYIAAYQQVKCITKLDLNGELVWQQRAPMQSSAYAEGEDRVTENKWGRDRFMPTNFAFLDDGDFFLADGYGSYLIHRYDKDGNWKSAFGGAGDGEGKFNLPHGIWIDKRGGREAELVVTDRSRGNVQFLTLTGKHLRTQTGYGLPANVKTYDNLLLLPELHAKVTLLNERNEIIVSLGDDAKRITSEKGIREDESKWIDGKFVHPHDACFDANGNIFVAEWVKTGRVSFLERIQ